nr:IPT/TIG domain, FG-GAP repeat-containing protein [uncultured bacterium]
MTTKRIHFLGVAAALAFAGSAVAMQFSGWATALKIDDVGGNSSELNTPSLDGCPIQSPDGLSLYIASNRPGGLGGLDIWVATRERSDAPWGTPQNLPEPINSASDDFCPTPVRGSGLFFASRRVDAGVTCGLGDIYFSRFNRNHGWSEPQHFPCAPAGPNTILDEQGPSFVELEDNGYLYYSSSRAPAQGGFVPGDIYVSEAAGGGFGPGVAVGALNDSSANDIQPNVRKDGRELVFSSDRAGGLGGQDIWVSSRDSTSDAWSAPLNLGGAVNTGAGESRPSLSWHGEQLLFGRAPGPEGQSDVYVSTRDKR